MGSLEDCALNVVMAEDQPVCKAWPQLKEILAWGVTQYLRGWSPKPTVLFDPEWCTAACMSTTWINTAYTLYPGWVGPTIPSLGKAGWIFLFLEHTSFGLPGASVEPLT